MARSLSFGSRPGRERALCAPVIPALVNPAAGNAAEIDRALRDAGFAVQRVDRGAITQAARRAIAQGASRIVVAGGDGTISAAAAAVARTGVELAIVPAGTLNHFARDHGIPAALEDACAIAQAGRVEYADVAWVNGRLFLNTSSVGVYANFVRVREKLEPKLGYWLASALSVVRTFVRVQPFSVSLQTVGVQRQYTTPLVFIGVGERELKLPKLGGRLETGRFGLHVMVVRGRTRARMFALSFAAAARGIRAVARTPDFDSFLVTDCIIEQRHSKVAVDGEVVQLDSPLRYELGRNALKIVVGDR